MISESFLGWRCWAWTCTAQLTRLGVISSDDSYGLTWASTLPDPTVSAWAPKWADPVVPSFPRYLGWSEMVLVPSEEEVLGALWNTYQGICQEL